MNNRPAVLAFVLLLLGISNVLADNITEFCLSGQFDLGTRYQGTDPGLGETYPTTWCVTTEQDSNRVFYSATGRSNSDIDSEWSIAYLPPEVVTIVDKNARQIIQFSDMNNLEEALKLRRVDPRRLLEEVRANRTPSDVTVETRGGYVVGVQTFADLPLRGNVQVDWSWDWKNPNEPGLRLLVDDELLFAATGKWRTISAADAEELWETPSSFELIEVPGIYWPSIVDMRLVTLADDVYMVDGVRSGFRHIVINTTEGLVIGDAPAGWVEFHHIPPSDLVPGLGVSGLSEALIDFLTINLPDRPISAVALTHFHDDHAGGARAFAAEGANIYAPAGSANFLEAALNRPEAYDDRFQALGKNIEVKPVSGRTRIIESEPIVELIELGPGPHTSSSLGIWIPDRGLFFQSDLHVPRSTSDEPRADRAVTECWFAQWAVDNLPSDAIVVSSHVEQTTPVSRLAQYLESDLCTNT